MKKDFKEFEKILKQKVFDKDYHQTHNGNKFPDHDKRLQEALKMYHEWLNSDSSEV